MQIATRKNTCDSSMGEITLDTSMGKLIFDYDRDDLAHELINAHRDLFDSTDDWLAHLSHYLDDSDVKNLHPMMLDGDGNRSIFDDVDT